MRGCFSSCKSEEESGLTPTDLNNAVWRKRPQRCLDFYLRAVLYLNALH
ncbi:MAG: hypothetical protein PHR24_03910 [Oscillospiraceae bacterium]|nr:hypothetical protein [Oscillospiraceae bacterium]MDD3832474.1 hypothetical protein [Oscillospiraceae bacterium]MDD4546418.1 hypothetical protein [Oscillospiraceae bacterium]